MIAALIFSLIFSGFTSVNIFAVLMSVVITVIPIAAFVSFAGIISVQERRTAYEPKKIIKRIKLAGQISIR